MINMEEDGFKLVRHRRRKLLQKSIDTTTHEYMNDLGTLNLNSENDIIEKINKCLNEISYFVEDFDAVLKEILTSNNQNESTSTIGQIVCFGLGNFTRSRSSMYQLALLRHLMKHEKFLNHHYENKFIAYDPIFTEFEKNILKSFGFQILQNNNDCRYPIIQSSSLESITLLFMPHMDYNHYYNVLDCNRENIDHLIIFGNSLDICLNEKYFTEYSTDLRRFLQEISEQKFLIEHHLLMNNNNNFYNEIFYRQSLHRFLPK